MGRAQKPLMVLYVSLNDELGGAEWVLQLGGLFTMTAPQSALLHEAGENYFRYTKYDLAYLARASGFRVVEIRAFGGVIALVGQTIAWHFPVLLRNRLGEWLRGVRQAVIQWLLWHADRALHLIHDGAEESTIRHLLVTEKGSGDGFR